MPGPTPCPPFPQDVPTCPFLVIDYKLIKAGDADEIERLWKAAMETGVWYLTNHGVYEGAEGMFGMGEETIAFTLEDRLLFEQGGHDILFGYKADKGTRDVPEFVNNSKDDALAWPAVARRTYSSAVNAPMESTIAPFVKKSLAISNHLIGVLNDKLGLPAGALASLHKVEEFGGCTSRFIRAPSYPGPEEMTFLTAHTNFGSLSFLHNRLGGLQVLPPGSDQWFYVKPLPGHAICNIGDALKIFSGGILRSNIHHVVPSTNATLSCSSPSNDIVELRALSEQSECIAAAVTNAPPGKYALGVTAVERLVKRVKSQRVTNCKGAESWMERRGTEDTAIPNQGKI
ncbi:Clavaminate synthase-like protein [Epithele typhae]|uniref:Clavaminate synthase-like protein n=1 Tax=Epithele typhae TaxID=378194 RepID=UPI0020082816|nr:Clavaminate synthase-like protein [Epithele typhae]KAH9936740.1 Clavaminate synthase-like protein [Epithele typhae]